jgi:hypothetical protein
MTGTISQFLKEPITSVVLGICERKETGNKSEEVAMELRNCWADARYAGYFENVVVAVKGDGERTAFENVFPVHKE